MYALAKKAYIVLSLYCLLFLLKLETIASGKTTSAEKRLLHDLFEDYDKNTRPVLNASQPVQVEFELIITKLIELNIKTQTLTTLGWLSITWLDERLPWDASKYDGINHVVTDPSQIWLPDFTLVNSGDGSLFDDSSFKFFKIIIYHNGSIYWRPSGRFVSGCEIDVTYFPFDEQLCSFWFINWAYSGDQVNLTYSKRAKERLLERYVTNREWNILKLSVERNDVHYNFAPETFPEVHFTIIFKRKPMIYIVNIMMISLCFAFILLSSFKLPIKSGERITMIVSLLVAFSVLTLTIQQNIPQTSDSVPFITIYMVSFMCLNTVGIFETILVLYLYHHKTTTRPPLWIRSLPMKFRYLKHVKMNALCRWCRRSNQNENDAYQQLNVQIPFESDEDLKPNTSKSNVQQPPQVKVYCTKRKKNSFKSKKTDRKPNLSFVNQKELNGHKEWETAAKMVDKFTFWLFIVIFCLMLFIFVVVGASLNNIKTLKRQFI